MTELPSHFEAVYRAQTRQLLVERTRLTFKIGTLLYAAFALLDLTVAYEHRFYFIAIRVFVVAIATAALAATHTRVGQKLIVPLAIALLFVASLGISAMAATLGGFSSDYYIGNLLVLFIVGLFMPWPPLASLTLSGLVLGGYMAINLIQHGPALQLATPVAFLLSTGVFAYFSTQAGERTRRRDLSLRLQLEHANEELKRLDDTKTRFFANVSHELRTPLMLILGPLEAMLHDESKAMDGSLLNTMAANARRLLRQVNMLLDFARLEASRLELHLATDNVGRILQELVVAARAFAEQRGIELGTEGLEDLADSELDRDKIETVAANLLSNALKFTPKGGRVTVGAASDSGHIRFFVADTGCGIAAAERDLVFNRFHQVDGDPAKTREGTGLGLAMVKELVTLHGGQVRLESELGVGSTFIVEMPRQPHTLTERRKAPRRRADRFAQAKLELSLARPNPTGRHRTLFADIAVQATPVAEDGSKLWPGPINAPRVLLAEDKPDLRAFLAETLCRHFNVEATAHGRHALLAMRRTLPDIVISDIMMPEMDGHELVRAIRADPDLAQTPVILLTARGGSEAAVAGLDAGASDYVTKPVDLEELRARIAAHLRTRALEKQLHDRDSRLVAIGHWTSRVVHDLRSPLAAIKGYAYVGRQVVATGSETANLTEDLLAIEQAVDDVVVMVQDILDFARGDQIRLDKRSTPLTTFVRTTCTELAASLKDTPITLVVDGADDGGPQVPIDQFRMRRVITNLVSNASEALRASGRADEQPRISVRVCGEGGQASIWVSDNGPGVDPQLASKLFTPFATGKAHGTGLGLAIVRDVAVAHGGAVRFENPPEGGARFEVCLPLS